MVDRNSASASEIVAGALQDLQRATIVGERTFGKGLVQNIRPIAYDGHIKITTAKYYLPSGRCIQAIDYAERQKGNKLHRDTAGGIMPDIVLTDSQKLDITYQLYTQHMFFDYATHYRLTHESIPQAKDFTLTDKDLHDFCAFLQQRNFVYETETAKYIKDLVKMAQKEDIDQTIIDELNTLLEHISSDYEQAIFRNREEVVALLGAEIVKRYYYQQGYAAYNLRYDKDLHQTLDHISKQ
jgi:carboxyl-terminal processing protease